MKNIKNSRFLFSITGLLAIIVSWQSILMLKLVEPILLPYPEKVFFELIQFFTTKSFWLDLLNTTSAWIVGLIGGIVLGVSIGLLLALNEKIWFIFEPIVEFLRSLPSIVLVPLISLFLGVGINSKISCVIIVVAVTIISTIGISIRGINITYKRLQTAWKLSLIDKLRHIYLPEIASHLLVAIKASIPLALIVAVASDMLIATDNGIGKIITDSMAVFDTKKMYAAIIVVGFLGYISAKLSTFIENSFIHWKGK
ncbi:MAG: hypothetical protein HGB12_04925 [Bacteroidetes bacterium]|nr:hypothetical protein [Bacteroidota bacterium]